MSKLLSLGCVMDGNIVQPIKSTDGIINIESDSYSECSHTKSGSHKELPFRLILNKPSFCHKIVIIPRVAPYTFLDKLKIYASNDNITTVENANLLGTFTAELSIENIATFDINSDIKYKYYLFVNESSLAGPVWYWTEFQFFGAEKLELNRDYDFPVKVGDEIDVLDYAANLTDGEEQLLITREGDLYITNGEGGFTNISKSDLSNYYDKQEVDNLIANIDNECLVKTVNQTSPDENGNIKISSNQILCWDDHGLNLGNVHNYIEHFSENDHVHNNLDIVETITQEDINKWNSDSSTDVDLTHLATKEELKFTKEELLNTIEQIPGFDTDLSVYALKDETYNKTEVDTKISEIECNGGGSMNLTTLFDGNANAVGVYNLLDDISKYKYIYCELKHKPQALPSIIPTMTSNVLPAPYVATSSACSQQPYGAFDGIVGFNSQVWYSSGIPAWIQIDAGASNTLSGFSIYNGSSSSGFGSYPPKSFTFQYSNDGTNFTIAKTVENMKLLNPSEAISFEFDKPISGRYFKLNFTAGYNTSIIIGELKLHKYIDYSSYSTIHLVKNNATVNDNDKIYIHDNKIEILSVGTDRNVTKVIGIM